jgi:hypothetical protein
LLKYEKSERGFLLNHAREIKIDIIVIILGFDKICKVRDA